MNPEKYIQQRETEAVRINERLDDVREDHPRSRKANNQVAGEIIKNEVRPLDYSELREEDRPWYMSMRGRGIRILEDGFLDISKWEQNPQGRKRVTRHKVGDLHTAIRMQEHIIRGYRHDTEAKPSEITTLESIEETITYAQELLSRWGSVTSTEREVLKNELTDVVLSLEKCRNEYKIKAEEQTEAVARLKDSRGRENPSALSARTVAALDNLSKRLEEIHAITPLIALRKEMLVLEAKRLKGILKKAKSTITIASRHTYFTPRVLQNPHLIQEGQLSLLGEKIQACIEDLRGVKIQPYMARAEQTRFFLATLLPYMRSKEAFTHNAHHVVVVLADVSRILTFPQPNE